MLNSVTNYKKKQKQQQKLEIMQKKSEKLVWKLVVLKAWKPSIKTIGHKISLCSIRRKGWPVFTVNKQKVDQNNIKSSQVHKIKEISL